MFTAGSNRDIGKVKMFVSSASFETVLGVLRGQFIYLFNRTLTAQLIPSSQHFTVQQPVLWLRCERSLEAERMQIALRLCCVRPKWPDK